MTYVILHDVWMVATALVVVAAAYVGLLRATQGADGRSPLPGRFKFRLHVALGVIACAMVLLGAVGGWVMGGILLKGPVMPPKIVELHVALAGAIVMLALIGAVLGVTLVKRPPGAKRARPRAHMAVNVLLVLAAVVQIVVAFYYVWFLPA